MGAPIASRVSGLEELAHWIAAAGARGAVRFELWIKMRGSEQERVTVGSSAEPFEVADELLAQVERDRRVELGQAAYAVFAYREKDKAPAERAFVSLAARAIAVPVAGDGANGSAAAANPSAALASVLSSVHGMTRDAFGSLQRENEHQRKTNEAMLRASTGSFETFAKGYERTFGDLQTRLETALKESVLLRTQNEALERQNRELATTLEEISKINVREIADAERREKRDQAGFELLKLAAPAVVAKITNKPLDTAVLGPTFAAFLDSITDEQVPRVLAAFREPQQLFVLEILRGHRALKKNASATNVGAGDAGDGFVDGAKARGASAANTSAPNAGASPVRTLDPTAPEPDTADKVTA